MDGSGTHSSPYSQVWFTIQRCFTHCTGTYYCMHTCHLQHSFPCLSQGSTHAPHPGHPAACAQGQEGAQWGSSAVTGSYFQAGAFTSGPMATLWLCLCPTWQPSMQTLTHCLAFPALPVTCLVAKDFSWKTSKHQKSDTKVLGGWTHLLRHLIFVKQVELCKACWKMQFPGKGNIWLV